MNLIINIFFNILDNNFIKKLYRKLTFINLVYWFDQFDI